MKVTLPNGLTVEGTLEQVNAVVTSLGYKATVDTDYYYSKSRNEYLLIKDMNTTHLRNAILRFYEDWVKELHNIKNPQRVVRSIRDGINDPTWLAMVREYYTREEE